MWRGSLISYPWHAREQSPEAFLRRKRIHCENLGVMLFVITRFVYSKSLPSSLINSFLHFPRAVGISAQHTAQHMNWRPTKSRLSPSLALS